jgi:hypothetical protein
VSRTRDRDPSGLQLGGGPIEIPRSEAAAAERLIRRRDAARSVPADQTEALLAMLGIDEVLAS